MNIPNAMQSNAMQPRATQCNPMPCNVIQSKAAAFYSIALHFYSDAKQALIQSISMQFKIQYWVDTFMQNSVQQNAVYSLKCWDAECTEVFNGVQCSVDDTVALECFFEESNSAVVNSC